MKILAAYIICVIVFLPMTPMNESIMNTTSGDSNYRRNCLPCPGIRAMGVGMAKKRWIVMSRNAAELPVFYHCVSRVVDRKLVFGPDEKEPSEIASPLGLPAGWRRSPPAKVPDVHADAGELHRLPSGGLFVKNNPSSEESGCFSHN
jgi:hypothetical protein